MARTIAILAAAALALSALAGCAKKDTPKAAFQSWLLAVEACDSPRMKAGLTKASIGQVEMLVKQLKAFVPAEKQASFDLLSELCKGYKKGSIEILDEKVDGTQAVLKLKSDGKDMDAPMVQEEGAWKLDFAALMKQALSTSFGAKPPAPAPAAPEAAPPATPAPAPAP
jgi:hypothetical protein